MRRWWVGLLGVSLLPSTALAAGGHEAFSWFELLSLPVPQYVLSAILIAVLLVAVSAVSFRGKNTADLVIPEPRLTMRNVFELIMAFLMGLAEDIIGHKAKRYIPLLATTFIFILFMNLLGLIPGFVPPTDKMNITVGLAVVIFLSTHYYGVKEHGIAYFKHFLGPVWWLAWLIAPIEIISHLARPMSLSLRLFGNITGDHLVVAIFLGLVPFVVPSIFYGLGVFVSFMQAFIFTVLSMIYIGGAVAHEEEH
ncbi:MAG TPA: F0F1 ATP synthase subunit A [Candidatus Bathyarchaeia archaeon]|nr:F0F1 ATP synthase subunit A [Candidatus Bathyarchaeia archaeon]